MSKEVSVVLTKEEADKVRLLLRGEMVSIEREAGQHPVEESARELYAEVAKVSAILVKVTDAMKEA